MTRKNKQTGEVTLKSTTQNVVVDGDHVLDSVVEVFQEYKQRYDKENNELLIGPTRVEDKCNAYTHYECSCGASFDDQTEANEHLIKVAHDSHK